MKYRQQCSSCITLGILVKYTQSTKHIKAYDVRQQAMILYTCSITIPISAAPFLSSHNVMSVVLHPIGGTLVVAGYEVLPDYQSLLVVLDGIANTSYFV